ncbi:MAG: hypothetical protein L7R84_02595, partial [Balneolaceae bacterium]|nr:hypothetical protein [Balneolaceae bacterium]
PILSTALSIGLLLIGLERATHQKFTVCSLLKPLKRKWHLLAFYYIVATYTILSFGLLALIGISTTHLLASNLIGIVLALLLALIPIYYYFTHIYFAGILIYTKKMKATSALRSSHKMVAKNLKLCAWFVVIYLLQMILSSLLLFIPLLWILPKFAIAYGLLFEHLFAKEILSIEDARA